VVGSQDFVAWLEFQGMSNDVHAMCGIGDVDQVLGISVEILPKCSTGIL
jgi:hypothetical protein